MNLECSSNAMLACHEHTLGSCDAFRQHSPAAPLQISQRHFQCQHISCLWFAE